jgi:transcriptional regulator of met regulon
LVAVVISVPDERHGSRVEYSKHIDDVPRRTLDAGTSEAARRALYYLCHAYREEL